MAKTDLNPSPLALDSWFLSLTQASPKPQDKKGVGEGQATKVRRMTAASGLEMASHRRNFCSLNLFLPLQNGELQFLPRVQAP